MGNASVSGSMGNTPNKSCYCEHYEINSLLAFNSTLKCGRNVFTRFFWGGVGGWLQQEYIYR